MDGRAVNAEMQALLEHASWVRELAHRLVRDPAQADDLVQETWVAALAERSAPVRSSRAWLGAVVKRLAWQRLRGEGRRRVREESAARAEAQPSAGELFERMSAHRQVVEAVMELPETYRTVLLRRYFEGETPTEIARAQGVPISTVKTRLQRALARLRETLDEQSGGDGSSWALALAPLLRAGDVGVATSVGSESSSAGQATPTGGTSAGSPVGAAAKGPGSNGADAIADGSIAGVAGGGATIAPATAAAWLAGFALVASGFVLWLSGLAGEPAPHGEVALAPDVVPPTLDAAPRPARSARNAQPTPAATNETIERADSALAATARPLRGRVLDAGGTPMGFVLVEFESFGEVDSGADAVAISGADGRFELRGTQGAGRLRSGRADLETICAAEVGREAPAHELVVVVGQRLELRGTVVDESDRPLGEARIELVSPPELRARTGARLDAATPYRPVTESDAKGEFSLGVARVPGAEWLVRREGFEPLRAASPSGDEPVRWRLRRARLALDRPRVSGRVLDFDGRPAADVLVSLGGVATRSDRDGRFELPLSGSFAKAAPALSTGTRLAGTLVAARAGRAPAFASLDDWLAHPLPTRDARTGELAPLADVELRLGETPLAIEGRLVDEEGRPRAGVLVWLADATVMAVPAGDDEEGDLTFRLSSADHPSPRELPLVAECLALGRRHRPWTSVRTAADGRFRLEGLGARAYRPAALDPVTLDVRTFDPIAAGERDGLWVLGREGEARELRARLVDSTGAPLPGLWVELERDAEAVVLEGHSLITRRHRREGVRSDRDGRFVWRGLPASGGLLAVRGDGVVPRKWELAQLARFVVGGGHGEAGELELGLWRDTELRIELFDASEADAFALLNADSEPLEMRLERGGEWRATTRSPLHDGRSELVRAPLAARTLVLFREAGRVREVDLRLAAEGVNIVRP